MLQFPTVDRDAVTSFVVLLKQFNEETAEKAESYMVSRQRRLSCFELIRFNSQKTNVLRLQDTVPVIDDSDNDLDESPEASIIAPLADGKVIKHWEGSLDADLIGRIGRVTRCTITHKLDSKGLLVQGANIVDAEQAVKKLETVAAMMVSSASVAYSGIKTNTHKFLGTEKVLPHHP